ncbi:MAG: translation initiation factor IF-3 [Acetomicrobium sp.]
MAKANEPRVNEEIKVSEVLLIDADGTKVGVIPIEQALQVAESRGLDLVEVAPHANPPVCRVRDYGKYKYQQQKRDKEARKKQKTQTIKEIKMRPKIDEHDYNFKVKAIQRFLRDGHRAKVSVFFRGREMSFLDKGREVLERVARDCDGLGKVDSQPKMEGRYMRMMLVPVLQKSESKSSKD